MANLVFIQRLWCEYPGTEILSGILRKNGHNTRVIIENSPRKVIKQLSPGDIAAFSVMTGMHHWALKVTSEIKEKLGVLTVWGGPHPTYFPEIINENGIDIICRGEGDYVLLDLANAIDRDENVAEIRNLWVKEDGRIRKNLLRPLVDNLDTLPFQDRNLYYASYPSLKNNPHKIFLGGRGCPYACTFCFNEQLRNMYRGLGKYVRFRSPSNIIEEIENVRQRYPLKTVFFNDDIFVLDPVWLKEFLVLYANEVSLPFYATARADTLAEDTVRLLKKAGCKCVSFAIESGNEEIRNKILGKKITNQQIIDAGRILKKYGIRFATFNMVGIPGETAQDAFKTMEINVTIGTDYPRCSFLTPYPGTRIAEYAKRMGYIESTVDSIMPFSQQKSTLLKIDSKDQVLNVHSFFQTAVLLPWLMPAIKKVVKLPPNAIFKAWWMVVYFFVFSKSEGRSRKEMFFFARRSFHSFIEKHLDK